MLEELFDVQIAVYSIAELSGVSGVRKKRTAVTALRTPSKRGSSPTLSMREKTLHKRRITKEHNSNFHAGYVHINEEYLHKTGIRGRKRYFVYAILILMGLVAVINIFITWVIMGSLRISKHGMGSLEFVPPSHLLRFLGRSDMGDVVLVEDTLLSLSDREMEVSGMNNNPVHLQGSKQNTTLTVTTQAISFTNMQEFLVTDPESGRTVFTTDYARLRFPEETQGIKTDKVTTSRVVSPDGAELRLESDQETILRGAEGIFADGKQVVLTARGNIDIKTDQDLVLDGKSSIYLDQVKKMATASGREWDTNESTYRLCVCMPHGRVFAVPAPFHCDQANEENNPCEEEE